MSKEINWSKAPEGATHYLPESEKYFASWIKPGFSMREETQLDWVEDEDDSAEHLYIARPNTWNGEGLPPVGTVCEYLTVDLGEYWCKASVSYVGTHWVIVGYKHPTEGLSEAGVNHFLLEGDLSSRLRPIRTAEQIAAEERAAAIKEMTHATGHELLGEWAAYVYDKLGYRKCSE